MELSRERTMQIKCYLCQKPVELEQSYVYVARERKYRKTEKTDYEKIPPYVINTSSRTDLLFVCEDCFREKTK
jgi:hypothetical protein